MVSEPFESSEGSAMDEEALVALGFQFLKKENDQLSKMNSGMAELTLESKSLLNDVRELKAMVYQYFNIPIPTHKVAKEVSIMASELSDQHNGTRCEQLAVNENSFCSAHQVFDETPKSANTIEVEQIDESSEDGGEALFEIVGNIKRDEERPTKSDEKDKTARAHSITNGDEGLIEDVLKINVSLEQDLAAHHVLEGMTRIIDESIVDELDFKITPGSLTAELNDMKDFEISDLNHVTSLSLVENVAADLVRFLRKPPNQEEVVMEYIGLLCFDPRGNSARVLLGRHILDYDLSYYRHLNFIELINWHAKLNLERSDFGVKTLILTWSSLLIYVESFIFDPGGECYMRIEVVEIVICKAWVHSTLTAFTYVFAALVALVNTKSPRIGDLLLRRIVLQLIRAYKRNDKPQLVAAAKFIVHLVNQMVCHELIALELLEILLAWPTDDSVEVVIGFVTECGAILQDLSPMGPSVMRFYVQGKEINGTGINSSFATMYAHWVASLTLAEFWVTQIYGFVFDPGGEVAGVLCEKSNVDCDLSNY